jgi:hypothetical protein
MFLVFSNHFDMHIKNNFFKNKKTSLACILAQKTI